MKNPFQTIDVTPVKEEVISSEEFVRMSINSPHLIARSRFVPPAIGKRDFGRFEVRYTVPMFRHKEAA